MPPQLSKSTAAQQSDSIDAGLRPDRPVEDARQSKLWFALRGLGFVLLAVAWALAAHLTSVGNESSGWGAALALTPMATALALGLWRLSLRWLGAMIGLGIAAGLVALWPFLAGQVALLYYLEHLGVYILLSVFFGRTLFGPDEPLVTRMARRVHAGMLSPAQEVYTRRVTLAWCIFFASMALVSTLLFLQAPIVVWSSFVNLLGGPLIALMFAGEYLWRRRAFPEEKPASVAETVRAWQAQR